MFKIRKLNYKGILNNLDMTIDPKKVTSILGVSGSGKTTLLKHLNKMISPDSGTIYFKDTNIEEIPSVELRRKVVMLSQKPAAFLGTIKDNLEKGLIFSEQALEDKEVLVDILKQVHLNKSLDTPMDKLSGGEQQRVAIARVMLMDPEVLLLDEPSSSLDETTEKFVIESIVAYVKKHEKTLVMVTHHRGIAKEYSDEIIEI
jgi:putative ABC transport system ATP-binding protein